MSAACPTYFVAGAAIEFNPFPRVRPPLAADNCAGWLVLEGLFEMHDGCGRSQSHRAAFDVAEQAECQKVSHQLATVIVTVSVSVVPLVSVTSCLIVCVPLGTVAVFQGLPSPLKLNGVTPSVWNSVPSKK